MYTDVITPKSFPEQLQDTSYDYFNLMPAALPDHPRVFFDAAQLQRARIMMKTVPWAKNAFERLVKNCRTDNELVLPLTIETPAAMNTRVLGIACRNALAALLTGEKEFKERALRLMRMLAELYPQVPLKPHGNRMFAGSLNESHCHITLGHTYDLLCACGIDDADNSLFRAMLDKSEETMDGITHWTCGNHNSWALAGRLSVALALSDRRRIHDALYGCQRGTNWRYGIIHQLRHDFLSDGMHWERTIGYHYYTLMSFTEMADMFACSGGDLWHKELPSQHQNDGKDIHRAYGPNGMKCLKSAYDAPLYQVVSGKEFALLHDSGLGHMRGIYIWGILYDKAYEAYKDPKYAWLLNFTEKEYPAVKRQFPDLPMSLNTHNGDLDFARLKYTRYPRGAFSLATDCRISLEGRHQRASSLFPVQGWAILRDKPDNGLGAALFFGAHIAGHMAPAALALGLHAHGWRRTDGVRLAGYEDPFYLTWGRTTIAHNTVTVDETPMFPYDFPTESIWECDYFRDKISDGQLQLFQTEKMFKATRATNDNVYEGVILDRTVIVTKNYILDLFRVLGDKPRQYDWAVHGVGEIDTPADAVPCRLGTGRGYRHLIDIRQCRHPARIAGFEWRARPGATRLQIALPPKAEVYIAKDPVTGSAYGESGYTDPRMALIVRSHAKAALYAALWTFDTRTKAILEGVSGSADRDVTIKVCDGRKTTRWCLPRKYAEVSSQQSE